jgi:hypothetical protein
MIIAVLEGALQEYHQVTSAHAHGYHADHHNAASDEPDKEPVHYAWYEIIIMIMQSLWALVIGVIKSIWHTIRTWVELMLIAFECSELVHKLSERFKLGGT